MSKTDAGLIRSIESNHSAIVELTRRLVSLPTENPPGNHYPQAVELISSCLQQLGLHPERKEDCLLCFVGEGQRTLYFSGHYDVVPAQSMTQFEPILRGPNLFGRGSSDMKSGLAAMIHAAKAVHDSGLPLDGRIGLVFVPDEETAGPRGSCYLDKLGLLGRNGIGMLTPEPTGGVVWNANRGAITLKITIRGKPTHVGRHFEGVNAFEEMMRIAQDLAELKREIEMRQTAFEIQPDKARNSILMLGGQSSGGSNFNVVPDCCWFTVDRRLNPEEDFATEKKNLLALIARNRTSCQVDVEVLQEGRSSGVSQDTAIGRALARSVEEVTGTAPSFEMCPGLLETRFYAGHGIPAYAYGPGLLTVSHGPNEFVPIGNVIQCAKIYAMTAARVLMP